MRATLKTDDGALIYLSYNGIIQPSAEAMERLKRGEMLTTTDIPYFVTAPTLQTGSPKYAWLNSVQTAEKVVELQFGSHIKYDVFVLR